MSGPKPVMAVDGPEAERVPADPVLGEPEVSGNEAPPSPEKPTLPLMALFSLDPSKADDEQIQELVDRQVAAEIEKSGLAARYNVLLLYDDRSLTRVAADRLYSVMADADRERPILLILNSPGGDVSTAYFIAKLCREHTTKTFEVAVPRRAKSAATLICCGADRIHMGSLSELGPIDPQFGAIPALALKHSVEHIAELAGMYPAAREMFSDYLAKSLRIEALGFFERVAESAAQYAIRLLNARVSTPEDRDNEATAKRLVYAYKDHGFVIDSREALEIFGEKIVVCNSDEYRFSNTVFRSLDLASWICEKRFSRDLSHIGGLKQGCVVWKKDS